MKGSSIIISETSKETWSVSPNPARSGVIKMQMNLKDSKTLVFRLTDNAGRLLMTKKVEAVKGVNNIVLNEEQYVSPGTYFLQAVGVQGVKQLKVEN